MTVKLLSRVHWFTSCLMINSSLFSCLLRNAQILHESPIMSVQIIHPSSGIWQLKDDCIVIFIITVQFLRGFFHRAERAVVGLSDVKKTPVVLLCVYKKIVWGFCDPCAAWAGPCRVIWWEVRRRSCLCASLFDRVSWRCWSCLPATPSACPTLSVLPRLGLNAPINLKASFFHPDVTNS